MNHKKKNFQKGSKYKNYNISIRLKQHNSVCVCVCVCISTFLYNAPVTALYLFSVLFSTELLYKGFELVSYLTEPDSIGVHLLEYSTSTILRDLYFTRVSFLGCTHDFTQVDLRGKILYSLFHYITIHNHMRKSYYFLKKKK